MISKQSFLKNISDADERMLFAKAFDRASVAEKTYQPAFTDFMDPYKAHQLKEAFDGSDLKAVCCGGYEDAERMIVGFFPPYSTDGAACYELFPIAVLKISYNGKYSRVLTHRDFLGSVLGLGITRDKTGDIIPADGSAVIYVKEDIADFICTNLNKVAHTTVRADILTDYKPESASVSAKNFTVPSLRLDAVLSDALNIPRSRAADLIRGEKAFVNWHKVTSASKQLAEGDMITLRGTGRIKLVEVIGKTKKDRILISTIIYK